jgi:hypothetical protein
MRGIGVPSHSFWPPLARFRTQNSLARHLFRRQSPDAIDLC